jgi:hypothetical protein
VFVNRDREHEQRDRDREHTVAEGDDARELDLVLLPLPCLSFARHRGIIEIALDGTAGPPATLGDPSYNGERAPA